MTFTKNWRSRNPLGIGGGSASRLCGELALYYDLRRIMLIWMVINGTLG